MIILISGASHTGKTLLAQKLLEKYKYPILSIDLLKMGLIRSGNTSLTPEDDEKLEEYLWPIIREMIKTAIENKQSLIIEGAYPTAFSHNLIKVIMHIPINNNANNKRTICYNSYFRKKSQNKEK